MKIRFKLSELITIRGKSEKNPENHVFVCFFIIFLKRFGLDNTFYYFGKFSEITTNVALEIH